MKNKKVFLIIYINIVILIIGFMISRIFATPLETTTKQIAYGWYKVDLTKKIAESEIGDIDLSEYIDESENLTRGAYMDDLDDRFYVFCQQNNIPLPNMSVNSMIGIYAVNKTDLTAYKNPLDENNINGLFRYAKEQNQKVTEVNADSTAADLTVTYSNTNYDNGNYRYFSRDLNLKNASITKMGTSLSGNSKLSWDYAYIFAKTDKNKNKYETIYQRALWEAIGEVEGNKLMQLEDLVDIMETLCASDDPSTLISKYYTSDGYSAKSGTKYVAWDDNLKHIYDQLYNKNSAKDIAETLLQEAKDAQDLYKDAQAFKSYKESISYLDRPTLGISTENKYEFKYVENNKNAYFEAGPIMVDYGELVVDSLVVRKVTSVELFGKDKNNQTQKINTFYFVDKDGKEKIATTENFPKTGTEFYIRIYEKDNEINKLYNNLKNVDLFKVKFQVLDAEAEAYDISDAEIDYTEWESTTSGDSGGGKFIQARGDKSDFSSKRSSCNICYELHKGYEDDYSDWILVKYDSNGGECKTKEDISTVTANECSIHRGCEISTIYHNYELDEIPEYSKGYIDRVETAGGLRASLQSSISKNELLRSSNSGDNVLKSLGVKYTKSAQRVYLVANASLFWKEYELEVHFEEAPSTGTPTPSTGTPTPSTGTPTPTPSDTPTPEQPTYLDLGGKVWIDVPDGTKENVENGLYDEGTEKGKQNVVVTLYFEDGTPVKLGKNTLENGEVVEVIKDDRNVLCDPLASGEQDYETYTDEDGNYHFYYLPMGYKYYVEFKYDGSTYEPVNFLSDGKKYEIRSQEPTDYEKLDEYKKYVKENYESEVKDYTKEYITNKNIYDNNSKADDVTRGTLITRFKEITYQNVLLGSQTKENGYNITRGYLPNETIFERRNNLEYVTKNYTEIVENQTINCIRSKVITTTGVTDKNFATKEDDIKIKDVDRDIAIGQATSLHAVRARSITYPLSDSYTIWSVTNENELEYMQHINLGLRVREKADFALTTQIKAGAMTIKDKEKVVFYKASVKDEDLKIDGTTTQDEWIHQEISASDYNWKANFDKIYGDNATGYVVDKDKLNVYVLYRIVIQSQCENEDDFGKIHEIIDHYDNRLEMVPEDEIEKANNLFREQGLIAPENTISWVEGTTDQIVTWSTPETNSKNNSYQTIKTTNLNNLGNRRQEFTVGKDSKTSAIYLILKVKENGDVLNTGTNTDTDGIQNIAEIGSYGVYHRYNKRDDQIFPVGKIDKDSAPGNAIPGDKSTYEDDTDPAPMFRLEINWEPRKIEGNVWDDVNGDALKDDTGIENVQVDLIEYVYKDGAVTPVVRPGIKISKLSNGQYQFSVNKSDNIRTDRNGNYSFYVEGGNYAIRFTYGDRTMLMDGTAKKYNAQDYYVSRPNGVNNNNQYYYALSTLNQYNQLDKSMAFATETDLINYLKDPTHRKRVIELESREQTSKEYENKYYASDTKDNNMSNGREKSEMRINVIKESINLTYDLANKLDRLNGNDALNSVEANELEAYTKMEALSDIVLIDANDLANSSKVINLGLTERVKASRKLEKEVTRIVLKTNDGTTLVDTSDVSKLSGVQKLRDIQDTYISMDSDKIDGATLDIDYTLTISNDSSENDRLSNYIYSDTPIISDVKGTTNTKGDSEIIGGLANELNGQFANISTDSDLPVKMTVYDYVNINLEFRTADNTDAWSKVYDEDDGTSGLVDLSSGTSERIKRSEKYVSKVLQTSTAEVIANDSIKVPVHLGITLSENTSENDLNDFDFQNCAEIVKVESAAGRRDYDTVPGNYVPYEDVNEEDCARTGRTAITPPFGQERIFYVIAIVSATIVIAGVILIKKKVLKK